MSCKNPQLSTFELGITLMKIANAMEGFVSNIALANMFSQRGNLCKGYSVWEKSF